MKVFVSYAFTGEDATALQQRLEAVRAVLDELGVSYYINKFAPGWQDMMDRGANGGEFLHFALQELETSDVALILNASERRSEGMLMEVGAAVAMGKKIIFAQHQSSVGKTYLPTVADATFVWQTEQELLDNIRESFSAQTMLTK